MGAMRGLVVASSKIKKDSTSDESKDSVTVFCFCSALVYMAGKEKLIF